MALIHNANCFSEKYIRDKAEENGFSDPLYVEKFLWDCEIASQLQSESDCFVLKGGAAVQLHLPLEKQRGSVDIDIICHASKEIIEKAVENIGKRIDKIKFEVHVPKDPTVELNLITYYVKTPALICYGKDTNHIKIDFLMEEVSLPTEVVRNKRTFAVDVKELRCYSATSLIGDKLLALAENTIGIDVIDKLPKHLYDVYQLSSNMNISENQFSEIVDTIKKLTVLEAGYRKLKTTPEEAVQDIINTMNKYASLDQNNDNAELKKQLFIFQGAYVNESQRLRMYGWCTRITQIRFLSSLILDVIAERMSSAQASQKYNLALECSHALDNLSGKKIIDMRPKMLSLAHTKVPSCFKGAPLPRVFWDIVDRENVDGFAKLLLQST